MARNYWTAANAELVATHEFELQEYLEEKGVDLEDYISLVEIDPESCLESAFPYRSGYFAPAKIRESFTVMTLWLYKNYCQEEPAPLDYHTVKLCNTKECIQPHHYIEIPSSITTADFRRFIESAFGQFWFKTYIKRGTWRGTWASVWQTLEAPEAAPELGVELIAKSASIPMRHTGFASDIKALEILKESWDETISPIRWYQNASRAYRNWTQTMVTTRPTELSLDTIIANLTEEQKLVLLDRLQGGTLKSDQGQVVAPFEEV